MNSGDILQLIKTRRSIRKFVRKNIPDKILYEILEAGIWAPSGLNNQPWRFVILKERTFIERIAPLTKYSKIITESDFCVAVFYNITAGYDRDKVLMAIGSCIQNMMLFAHSAGIGSVWLGEILKNKPEVNKLLDVTEGNDLMALVAFGYPEEPGSSTRHNIDRLLLKSL